MNLERNKYGEFYDFYDFYDTDTEYDEYPSFEDDDIFEGISCFGIHCADDMDYNCW